MIDVSEAREPLPVSLAGLDGQDLVEWLGTMQLIRDFEEALDPLCLSGRIPGGVHVAVGQEAVAVGAMRALEPGDVVTSSHRPHHHGLARGVEPNAMMAELFGRADGTGGGRCGTMHIAAMDRHYYGGNGIVGAGLGLALGAALAAQVRGSGQVALGFFGDGAVNIGRVWEAINMAAAWKLPLIAFCENNLYAVETPTASVTGGDSIVRRAEGFGLPAVQVDGQDAGAVHRIVREARERALAGEGPTFVEALTYRYQGHNTGQVTSYRTDAEVEEWKALRDPIVRLRVALTASGLLDDDAYDALSARSRETVAAATAFADASPWPEPATADAGVTEIDPKLRGNP
jgi:TPP-dependent pyruvate/acetoin dehydrogenase alpha subunit